MQEFKCSNRYMKSATYKRLADMLVRNTYSAQIRVGESPWITCRVVESPGVALALAAGFSRDWLGVAESRFSPVENLNDEIHNELHDALESRESLDELDEIDRAEMDREYRENMWNNHDCDVD